MILTFCDAAQMLTFHKSSTNEALFSAVGYVVLEEQMQPCNTHFAVMDTKLGRRHHIRRKLGYWSLSSKGERYSAKVISKCFSQGFDSSFIMGLLQFFNIPQTGLWPDISV